MEASGCVCAGGSDGVRVLGGWGFTSPNASGGASSVDSPSSRSAAGSGTSWYLQSLTCRDHAREGRIYDMHMF
jgi:hypothetical protein